ncbi:MAG: TIGR00366 family protein [Vicingaceae bacterium]
MKWTERYADLFGKLLPGPFAIAVLLTILTFGLAFFFTGQEKELSKHYIDLVSYWEQGLWDRPLLVFAFQMMLMLVLGHALALTETAQRIIEASLQYCTTAARAAFLVTLLTICVSLFNWGLGLIFGAIFARKVAEYAHHHGISINYPLIGAAGYSGLMVWHGGISGSSLVKVAEPGHLKEMMSGIYTSEQLASLPVSIGFPETVFSSMNLYASVMVILLLPAAMYYLGRISAPKSGKMTPRRWIMQIDNQDIQGADKLNHSKLMAYLFASFILVGMVIRVGAVDNPMNMTFMTPDFINLFLFSLGLVLHGSFNRFMDAVGEAVSGAAGILIQFPLYFGIMGLMKNSGMVEALSNFFVSVSTGFTFPIFTFFSAGIVNIFVPSGGGQWAIQGPIIIQTANEMGISLNKCIMAMAYGDQLTNMLQPFWALPLLGITGLKAKEILPYTLFLLGMGFFIYLSALVIF